MVLLFSQNYRKSSIKPPGTYLFEAHLRRGLIETGGGGLIWEGGAYVI